MYIKHTWFTIIIGLFFLAGCSVNSEKHSDSGFNVLNDEYLLNERLETNDSEVVVETPATEHNKIAARRSFSLHLIAEVQPPVIDSDTVQATMVSIIGNSSRAAVSYNVQGSEHLGAVDAMQVTSGNGNTIRIRSGVEFTNAKANAVHFGTGGLWVSLSSEEPALTGNNGFSAVKKFNVSGFKINDNSTNFGLPGFAANSVKEDDGRVYVTSGNDAGLTVLNSDLSEQIGYIELPGARWVDTDEDEDRIVVLASNPVNGISSLHVIDINSLEILNEFPFEGADTPEAKSTVDLRGDLALIAAGKSGTHIMDITSGEIIVTIPIPDPVDNGLNEAGVETNAVSADEEYIFISNGEAGVYVAEASMDLEDYNSGDDLTVELIGHLMFDEYQSVNHVAYRNKTLFIASGLGGVKAVKLSRRNNFVGK